MEFPTVTLEGLLNKLQEHDLGSNDLVQMALAKLKDFYRDDKRKNQYPVLEGHLYPVAIYVIEHQEFTHQRVTPELVAGALTHDLIEDKINEQLFISIFGESLYRIVKPLTKPDMAIDAEYGEWRRARNRENFSILETAPQESKIIKLADRLHNMFCIYRPKLIQLYIEDAEEFYLPFARKFSPYFYVRIKERVEELKRMQP